MDMIDLTDTPNKIKSKKQTHTFELSPICEDVMFKKILALDDSKKVSGSIPTKMLKLAARYCVPVLTKCFNSSIIDSSVFPSLLSLAEIIPLYKKGSFTDKVNYRPVSLLPTVSKVFERILAKQLLPFFNTFLSKYLCGFRKSYSCQYAILNMLQKWQKCLSKSGKVGAVLMDLSKAFDCLPFEGDICNFADDNTIFSCKSSITAVLGSLHSDIVKVVNWFNSNGMVANPSKFQMIILGADVGNISIQIGSSSIAPSKQVKLLGITLDEKLSFYPHVKGMCKSASSKTKALLRIRNFLKQDQIDLLFNSFILPCFNYCPLVWMFCSKQAHNLISATHKRALCAKTGLVQKTYTEILEISSMMPIHDRNLKSLVTEVYKCLHGLNPELMWDIFRKKETTYSLRRGTVLVIPPSKSSIGQNSFQFRASLAWNYLPACVKNVTDLKEFKSVIRHVEIYCQSKNTSGTLQNLLLPKHHPSINKVHQKIVYFEVL
ncbi:uncharacterized protein LOC130648536 [Hydractinia symbiolongicarpus]|uniref:uncharacterized protein LOC130648536 n=1 Tax=Hydractinia symbiolongicarpus TaxID=13093 RepID=UPI002550F6EF|nr:uncharacterized protein LOC130648536 [Hydractinia symbiolongicarpus]